MEYAGQYLKQCSISTYQNMHDLAVVGGGPAGLHLAFRMAEAGYETVVFDRRSEIGSRRICTGIIGAEAFHHLGLPRRSIIGGIQSLRFISPSGTALDYRHSSLLAHIVDRSIFDRDLALRAQQAGATIVTGAQVKNLSVGTQAVRIETSGESLDTNICDSRLVALATGVGSSLNRRAGLGQVSAFMHAVQASVPIRESVEHTYCFAGREIAPGGFGWMVPVKGYARVGLMADRNAPDYFAKLMERVAPFRTEPEQHVAANYKRIAQAFSGPSFAARAVAVGESAGQVKTTTGGGIYYALLGAGHAFDTLSQALERGRCDAGFLADYERRWKGQLEQERSTGLYYRQLWTSLSDRKLETLFKLARINGIIPLVRKTANFDWHRNVLTSVSRYGLVRRILGLPAEIERGIQ
jgi:digeranylgeranylglycerophospholipid reductase